MAIETRNVKIYEVSQANPYGKLGTQVIKKAGQPAIPLGNRKFWFTGSDEINLEKIEKVEMDAHEDAILVRLVVTSDEPSSLIIFEKPQSGAHIESWEKNQDKQGFWTLTMLVLVTKNFKQMKVFKVPPQHSGTSFPSEPFVTLQGGAVAWGFPPHLVM